DEFAHLAAALADERDHHRVEALAARQHRQQRRLADARAREDADALAGAKRSEEVDDPDARAQGRLDARAAHRGRRRGVARELALAAAERPHAVDRLAERVDDASLPARMRGERQTAEAIDGGAEPDIE